MYNPPHFQEKNRAVLYKSIKEITVATVITAEPILEASFIPLWLVEEEGEFGTLYGHLALPNPQVQAEGEALVIFQGPDAYISPSWYPSKQENGKAVPTWNYIRIEARGEIEFFKDAPQLLSLLAELTEKHEKNQPHPWKISDAPEDYTNALLKAIVGFKIRLRSLEGKWKLSQNRKPEDQEGIIKAMAQNPAMLAKMQERNV